MARRSDHSGQELTALTLQAAETIVREEGREALSARRIARDIGYTPGTLYNHFEDLDDILLRLNIRSLERLKGQLEAAATAQDGPRARIHALAEAYMAFAQSEPRLWEALTQFRRAKGGPPPAWYLAEVSALIGLVARVLEPLAPGSSAQDRDYHARRLWASIHGICALAAAGSIGRALVTPMDQMVHDLIDLQCDTLERAPQSK